ncbi:Trihelix transcription factor GTL1 [Forsythia ovata]|uniref:Trihelix transcription factor GTL1 n=1 Tax=Forsythia ovata TaxID=205694 RepID=A0ABD1SKY3_9LAMI
MVLSYMEERTARRTLAEVYVASDRYTWWASKMDLTQTQYSALANFTKEFDKAQSTNLVVVTNSLVKSHVTLNFAAGLLSRKVLLSFFHPYDIECTSSPTSFLDDFALVSSTYSDKVMGMVEQDIACMGGFEVFEGYYLEKNESSSSLMEELNFLDCDNSKELFEQELMHHPQPPLQPPTMHTTNPPQTHNFQPSRPNISTSHLSISTSSDEDIQRRHKRKRKWMDYFERLMKDVVVKQEELQKKFLEMLKKREKDRRGFNKWRK